MAEVECHTRVYFCPTQIFKVWAVPHLPDTFMDFVNGAVEGGAGQKLLIDCKPQKARARDWCTHKRDHPRLC